MSVAETALDPVSRAFYRRVMHQMDAHGMPFLVGGAYAFERYTGIGRHTKDFDIFVHPRDVERALALLAADGCASELSFPHWLAKATCGDDVVDLIFSSGNGVALVDDLWFHHGVPETVLDVAVKLIPPEEMIWSKSFVMERERYDGADVAHLIRACRGRLDWRRLLDRFGPHWRVLLSHLILFGFIYPGERGAIPDDVMLGLCRALERDSGGTPTDERLCRGTLLSREQYLTDISRWGYEDGRLRPHGQLTTEDVERWTAAIDPGKGEENAGGDGR